MSNVSTPITSLNGFIRENTNITSIKKLNIDTSNVTSMGSMFYYCANLDLVNMSALDTSNVTDISSMFRMNTSPKLSTLDLSNCDLSNVSNQSNAFQSLGVWNRITNVYITEEATLMKLTNNLTAASYNYIPSAAIIYYNDQVYKWQNNAWTLQ
jgi:surface protein